VSLAGAGIRILVSGSFRSTSVAALLVSAGLLIAGCGSSNPTAKASPSPSPTPSKQAVIAKVDACTIVTAADASSVTGMAFTNLAAGPQIPGACFYGTSDGSATVLVFAQAYADSSTADAISPEQLASAMNGAYGIANAKAVSGIGDKAVEYSATASSGNGIVIFVFKSNVVFMIALTPSTSSTVIEKLATTAVSRL
jgi:hypothetical protein